MDVVNGRRQNVLELTAYASDSAACKSGGTCHKVVTDAPVVQTADWYGSVKFEVDAKVPAASVSTMVVITCPQLSYSCPGHVLGHLVISL